MKSARNQLLLLGILCQALSWDEWVMPLLTAGLWAGCLRAAAWGIRIPPAIELLLLAAGAAAAFFSTIARGESPHFFVGHGLTVVQLARLLRPLSSREKVVSLVIALVQIGVATTVITDFRFLPILLAAVVLVPRALAEVAVDVFAAQEADPERAPRLRWTLHALIGMVMVLAFVFLPRGFLGSPFGAPRPSGHDASTLEDSIMDPSRSAAAGSGRVIMQVQGEQLDYLRCHVLAEYDGARWSNQQRESLRRLAPANPEVRSNAMHRRVRVKHVRFLGRVLPTDGRARAVDGRFFRRPLMNGYGILECDSIWNTSNNTYDYWIEPEPEPEPLTERQRERYTALPPQSARLRQWLEAALDGETDPVRQADKLELILRTRFVYRLGAPVLDRLNPMDDFIFNQKEGHCERFASALTVMLRMQGIPSRVMIGYLPSGPNWFSGWYQIRFRDAHAWTEAWLPGRGWVRLDATPRATMAPPLWQAADLIEAIDTLWFVHVINFDGASQQELFAHWARAAGAGLEWVRRRAGMLAGSAVIAAIGFALLRWMRRRRTGPAQAPDGPAAASVRAAHSYYMRMLEAAAAAGYARLAHQTPIEFSQTLKDAGLRDWQEVDLVTRRFCASWYGGASLSGADLAEIERALERIQLGLHAVGGGTRSS